MKRMKLLFTLALPVLLIQNAQAQGSRLIAKADWHNNGAIFVPTDTTNYTYSGGRGGDLTHTMMYDDAMTAYYQDTAAAFVNTTNTLQTYNTDGTLYSMIAQTWNPILLSWTNVSQNLYFYTAGNLTTIVHQTWNGSNWANVSNDVLSYDPSNRLSQDKFGIFNSLTSLFDLSNETNYFYDGSGNMIQVNNLAVSGSTYTNVNQTNSTYNGNHQVLTNTYSQWTGLSYTPQYMNSYMYDSATGNKLSAQYSTYNTSTAAWTNVTLNTYSNFDGSMPMTELDQVWDTTGGGMWDNSIQYTYTYNANGQRTHSVGESWNVAGFWEFANGNPAANYYYEDFTTGVANVAAANGTVNVFPNPAVNTLSINLNWNEAQTSTIAIFNMSGMVVRQWSVPASLQYSTVIPVSNLADGNYIVKIAGTKGQMTQQVVVAH